jgi:hypothetical protein
MVVEGLDDEPAPVDAPGEGEGAEEGAGSGASAEADAEPVAEADAEGDAGTGADTEAGAGSSGGGADEPVMEPGAVRIGPILIDPTDDIVSAQKKLNNSLAEEGKGDVKIDLYPYFVAALRGRDFPRDATLMNFDLPTTLNIVI